MNLKTYIMFGNSRWNTTSSVTNMAFNEDKVDSIVNKDRKASGFSRRIDNIYDTIAAFGGDIGSNDCIPSGESRHCNAVVELDVTFENDTNHTFIRNKGKSSGNSRRCDAVDITKATSGDDIG